MKTLSELLDQARDLAPQKVDVLCQSNDVTFARQSIIADPEKRVSMLVSFEQPAWEQAADKLGIPVQYLRRCPEDLRYTNLNTWSAREKNGWFVRIFDDKVRAVLGKDYEKIDNLEVLAAVAEVLDGMSYTITSDYFDRDSMHLRFLFRNQDIKGDNYGTGVYVSNNETGDGSMKLRPFIQRTICSNSIQYKGSGFIMRHVRHSAAFVFGVIKEKMGQVFGASNELLERIVRAEADKIPDLASVIDRIARTHNLNSSIRDNILIGSEQSLNALGIVHGLSWAAHSARDISEKIRLEELAGAYLVDPQSVFAERIEE